jgi:inner membrane protein
VEPVTHVLTGVCLARTGPNRTTAYATLTLAIAAELPDIDTVWSLRGPVEGFQHHRGITHTFLGLPFEAALLVGCVWAFHRWRTHRNGTTAKAGTLAPRWGWLYGWALVGLLSHLLLDYTNNYGLRPFFPFDPHWYAASIVFIFDPLIFMLLAGGLLAPYLFGLVGSEVGARRQPFRGRGWAIAALLGVVACWSFRAWEHGRAVQLAQTQSVAAPQASDLDQPTVFLSPQRVLASPDPLSPFRWSTVADFGPVYRRAEVESRLNTLQPGDVLMPKPAWDAAQRAAAASPLGRAYLDWSPMPYITELPASDGSQATTVTFQDPRFLGGFLGGVLGSSRPPLTGTVTVDGHGHVLTQSMDGRTER